MAQNIILKRSGLAGKTPDTGSLNLGEVAINTYDGKVFFKRSGSVESIQEILTTNSTITGSLSMTGTGSFSSLQVNDTLTVNHGTTIISGSQLVTDELTVLGAINARQFNISVVSSSVIYESGSTQFGNTQDDIHSFTGSVNVTGSLFVNGTEIGGTGEGSYTGSFTGSFSGDGSGLRGVVSDDLPIDGWDYDSNSSASINDFNSSSNKYLIDFEWDSQMGTPIGHKTFISNVSGSTQIVPTDTGVKFVVGNSVVLTIDSNGIQLPAGIISSSAQLTSSYDNRYVLSGSITQTTWDNIASKPSGIVSGSSQIDITSTTGYTTFSSSIKTVTDTFPTSASVASATSASISDLSSSVKLVTDTFPSSASVASATSASISHLSGSIFTNYAKLNADNTFTGTQVITGSLYVSSNLVVQGSSSLQNITASAVSIGTNTIILNTANPSVRYAGISVVDSGSQAGKSGSLYFDSTDDEWIFVHQGNAAVTSSTVITGPETYDNLGNETHLTDNRVPKMENGFHIVDSNISDSGTLVTINSATQITGSLGVTGSTNFAELTGSLATFSSSLATSISASNYIITINSASVSSVSSSFNSRIITIEGKTLVSGSSQIDVMSTTNITRLATTGSNTFVGNQTVTGNILPEANGTRDLGSASLRWGTIYTSDLSLNNGIGDWTIVEGEDDLFLYNNKKGKVYKFALTEVDHNVATPKKS